MSRDGQGRRRSTPEISNDPDDDRLGVTRQVDGLRRLAVDRLGWPVLDRYVDDDKSAWTGKLRPQYRRMLDDLAAGRIDAVLVWHPDRLHRDRSSWRNSSRSASAPPSTTWRTSAGLAGRPGRRSARGSYPRRGGIRLQRQDGQAHPAQERRTGRQGLPVGGGTRPFGYRDDKLRIDPAEAALIRDAAPASSPARASARSPPSGSPRLATADRTLDRRDDAPDARTRARLSAPARAPGRGRGPAAWEAILTPEQTRRLRATFADEPAPRRRPTRRYFLTGLLRCGRCGATLISRPPPTATAGTSAPRVGTTGCGGLAVNAEPIEEFIARAILLRLDSPALASALATAGADPASAADRDGLRDDEASSRSSPASTPTGGSRCASGWPPGMPSRPAWRQPGSA